MRILDMHVVCFSMLQCFEELPTRGWCLFCMAGMAFTECFQHIEIEAVKWHSKGFTQKPFFRHHYFEIISK